MITTIIRLCQMHNDPVFGPLLVDWVATPPIRVTRNSLGRATVEWVGGPPISAEQLALLRARHPIAKYV